MEGSIPLSQASAASGTLRADGAPRRSTISGKGTTMGDKGGKKDKDKSRKQSDKKHDDKAQKALDKQPKKVPGKV